ncbi:MAG: DoxX family protein [Rhizobiales bacterium]|nr:DoxX family protein [Hyphomicrobiales bacterium]
MSDGLSLLSRILLSAVFIVYGYLKFVNVGSILGNDGTKRFMAMVAGGAAPPTWLGYLIAAIELIGGILILVGFKTRWAAYALVLWLIILTYLGHPFWGMDGPPRGANMSHFYKNLGLMGGFLLLALHGPGSYSVDERMSRS